MPTLAVVPSLAAHQVAPGQVLLTKKFVDGMIKYAELWRGPVVAVMRPQSEASTGNLDDAVFQTDQLPFEIRFTPFDKSIYSALADADAVMLGGDDLLNNLTVWCNKQGKKAVFVSEYSLKTRMQIIDAEVSNPFIRWRKYLWEWRQEQRNRRNVVLADAVQCNGTPTFDTYRHLNANTLLFLDSRVTSDMVTDEAVINARTADLNGHTPIRLAYSGRLTAMKGADDLVKVAMELRRLSIPFTLDVYGDGDLRPIMTQQIRDTGLEGIVRLHGIIDYATELLPAIRSSVDLFVCCHRQGDPSCTYLETFACGVPIAGYANEALSGLTRDHDVGWTTPLNRPELLAQSIAGLHRERAQLRTAGSAALQLARQHTFEKEFGARISQIRELMS
ncbi:MAG: glycosyltransferase [Gammaproteobacteria bacterium]|nr:glycosyltransferase [Gammaproteobacteria bacterium]